MTQKERNKKNFKKWHSENTDLHNKRVRQKYAEDKKKLNTAYLKKVIETKGLTDEEVQTAIAAKRRDIVIKKLRKKGLKVF